MGVRRVRSGEPGARVVQDAGTRRVGAATLEIPKQLAADLDVRKLVDRIRVALAVRLRDPQGRFVSSAGRRGFYRWVTRGDARVRPEHRAREGLIYSWEFAPPDGHAGKPFGCRCKAELVPDSEAVRVTAIVGTTALASASVELVFEYAARYLAQRFGDQGRAVLQRVITEWMRDAVLSGDGVNTPQAVNTAPI
jgi:SPP1 gp7 family putative phage head morphogenesis protein